MTIIRLVAMIRRLFLIFLLLLVFPTTVLSSSADGVSPSSKVSFTTNEMREHDRVWKIIQEACFGCWSGSMVTLELLKNNNELVVQKDSPERMNFRMWGRPKRRRFWNFVFPPQEGIWSVWNLRTLGDETNVPLRRIPVTRPTQLKIGFDSGVVLRVPYAYSKVPVTVIELGYWDKSGDGIRRTAVIGYKEKDGGDKQDMMFKDVTIVQQKSMEQKSFVGNTTDENDISILSLTPPFGLEEKVEKIMADFKVVEIESVQFQTMTRTKVQSKDIGLDAEKEATEVFENLLGRNLSSSNDGIISAVLPNGLLVSIPKCMKTSQPVIFAHHWSDSRTKRKRFRGMFQALCIRFDPESSEAVSATMYSYKKKKAELE